MAAPAPSPSSSSSSSSSTASPNITVKLGRHKPEHLLSDIQSFVVERHMYQPDMTSLVLSNQGGPYSATPTAATPEINIGDNAGTSTYMGEVVGLEPVY